MSRLIPIDFDAIQKARRGESQRHDNRRSGSDGSFGAWLLMFAAVGLSLFLWLRSVPGPGPDPRPDIDVDGLHVMVVYPDDMSSLPAGQMEFANSVKIADWVDEQGGKFRRYPESQDLSNEEQIWREIRSKLEPPNRVGAAKNRRLKVMPLPDGIEAGIRELESLR